MKRLLTVVLLFVLTFSEAVAQDSTSVSQNGDFASEWKNAEGAYSMGDFDTAVSVYEGLVTKGAVSSSLYYNLGNSYYRRGNIGKAILNYERALKIDPSDSDARHNLEMARTRTLDKIDSVPQFILVSWIRDFRYSLSSNTWAVLSLVLLAAGLFLLLLYRFSRSAAFRKVFFITSAVVFLFAIIFFLFSFSTANNAKSQDSGVVVENLGSVKSAPAAGGNSIFVLHEGTKVNILESVQGWCKIEIADGRQGWIKSSDIEII